MMKNTTNEREINYLESCIDTESRFFRTLAALSICLLVPTAMSLYLNYQYRDSIKIPIDILTTVILGTLNFLAAGATVLPWCRRNMLRRLLEETHDLSARERLDLERRRLRPLTRFFDSIANIGAETDRS